MADHPQANYMDINQQYNHIPPRKSCCQHYCGWKMIVLSTILALVFIAIGATLAFVGFYELTKGDVCTVPKLTCSGSPPSQTGYYNVKKNFPFGSKSFDYYYAANFYSNLTMNFNDTNIDMGTMNVCVQTKGSQEVGPFNCSMNYMYDYSNCAFHYLNGDCDINVSHNSTDNMLTGMQFSPSNDTLYMDFSSHSQITGGTYELVRGETPIIKCDNVIVGAPKEICPKVQSWEFLEKLNMIKGGY